MARRSVWDWFTSGTIEEFDQFGWIISASGYGDEVTVQIVIQPGDDCLTGRNPIGCYRAGYDVAEKAIQFAKERYEVRRVDYSLMDNRRSPIEMTLELSLARKKES